MTVPNDPHIIRPVLPDPDPITSQDVRDLHETVTGLAETIGAFNDRIGDGEKRLAVLAVLVGVVLLVGAGILGLAWHVKGVSACQAQQNDAFRAASVQSRQASDAQADEQIGEIDHQLTLLNIPPTSTLEQRAAVVAGYKDSLLSSRAATLNAKQRRAANPLPTGNC